MPCQNFIWKKVFLECESQVVGQPATLDELEAQLVQAVNSLDAGRGVNGETVFRRLRRRIREARG
jgi:hypothetical protein